MNANTNVNHFRYSANQNGPILLTGGSISIQWLPESDQQKLLAAATELIVNRTSPTVDHAINSDPAMKADPTLAVDMAPIRRVDDEHDMTISSHLAHNIARFQGQLRGSVNAIRQSILRLESKRRDQNFDNHRLVGKPLGTGLSNAQREKANVQREKGRPEVASAVPTQERGQASESKSAADRLPSKPIHRNARPRMWRRWVRIDRYLELRETAWRSKAERFGIGLEMEYIAPTGQEHWTDIDAILNILDHLVAMAISKSQRGDRISIHVVPHADDDHWLQFSVRSGGKGQAMDAIHAKSSKDIEKLELAIAQKYAGMLGGYLDQLRSLEDGTCWNLHLPADDLLSWLHRANGVGHQSLIEITIVDPQSLKPDLKRSLILDRALQATFDMRDRVIQISPNRYLWSGVESNLDLQATLSRFKEQLEKIGGAIGVAAKHQINIHLQGLGDLSEVLRRIEHRLTASSNWTPAPKTKPIASASNAPVSAKNRTVPAPKSGRIPTRDLKSARKNA